MNRGDRRARLGRRLQVVRHAQPDEVLEAVQDVDRTEELAGLPVPQAVVSRETTPEESPAAVEAPAPPALRKDQVARLEALTSLWERQVRLEGPPDATLLYAAPRPPVPPSRASAAVPVDPEPAWVPVDPGPPPTPDPTEVQERSAELLEEEAHGGHPEPAPAPVPGPPAPDGPSKRVSDWSSRHDPASLEYAVRDRLGSPVPLQDLVLEHGPILDQGTVPPLSVHDASACVGMAVVAAANVLDATSRPPTDRQAAGTFLHEADARAIYRRAQDLDAVSGADYAGTSVLAGMKAGQEAGWWDGYLWALKGTRDIAQALLQLRSPVVIGIPWSEDLEAPDAAGVIRPGGRPAGGHALAVIGLRLQLPGGHGAGPWFVLQQSRGPAEGVGGLVHVHHADLAQLLAGVGEAAVPLPRWGLS